MSVRELAASRGRLLPSWSRAALKKWDERLLRLEFELDRSTRLLLGAKHD